MVEQRENEPQHISDSDSLVSVSKRRVKSVTWNYFNLEGDELLKEDIDKPICKFQQKGLIMNSWYRVVE